MVVVGLYAGLPAPDRTDLGGRLMPRSSHQQYVVGSASSLALLLTLLTGCSSGAAEPAPLDHPSSAASTSAAADPTDSPSPTPSKSEPADASGPPALPPEARGTTRASAGPFVRYWVDSYAFAVNHLTPAAISRISLPLCEVCSLIAGSLARVKDAGGHFEGSGWRLDRVEVLPPGRANKPQVRAYITFTPQVVYERAGADPKRYKGGDKTVYTFNLAPSKGEWAVAGIIGVSQ